MQMGHARKTEKKEKTASLVKTFGKTETNTGSPEVQVALITNRINTLNPHFQKNKKDHHSRTGLLRLVGQRRRLLNYLKSKDEGKYTALLAQLDLRK
jgi:small subunit ribosomal protein S15